MKRGRLITSDFKLTFEEHTWAKERYLEFPVLRWPTGSLCEPATLFFGYSLQFRRGVGLSSLRPEAFTIREWLTFLANEGIPFNRANDLVLRSFRASHRPLVDSEETHPHQIERKLRTIYLFYRSLDDILRLNPTGTPRPRLVALDEKDKSFPITTALSYSRTGIPKYSWSGSEIVAPKNKRRPTPDLDAVKILLNWIRSKPDRLREKGALVTDEHLLAADRDWMIARCHSEAGFRRSEVSKFSIKHIISFLLDEGISTPVDPSAFANCSKDEQRRIIAELESLLIRTPYSFLFVAGKGRKTRYATVNVRFLIDLLKVWVWSGRQRLLSFRPIDHAPHEVFLSTETLQALKPGSVGDILKDAFIGCRVPGSGHRLRAHYCTVTAVRLWEEAMQKNGFNFSHAVFNTVLDRLAEAMGHSRVTTTVKYYLNLAVSGYYGFSSRAKYLAFQQIWGSVGDNFTRLSDMDIRGIVKIINAFAKPGTGQLKEIISLALANADLNPVSKTPTTTAKEPAVRLAFSYGNPTD
ncbi:hypothetical protein SAMN05892877_106338 [Rhizobium subbaraonis]|uniref:Phage integrase family protein n=1 Tax=Rhizobium subbaraonis TaxID=908946 RepID=A0A285UDR5_9HYPH|nr:phage integrase family protein [Rhizobium subbaraonis]SOC40020.1 hypothetical protein SAMN05892877_106338 [Rhizobium subbaraonis]